VEDFFVCVVFVWSKSNNIVGVVNNQGGMGLS